MIVHQFRFGDVPRTPNLLLWLCGDSGARFFRAGLPTSTKIGISGLPGRELGFVLTG